MIRAEVLSFYKQAKQYVIEHDTANKVYQEEIKWQNSVSFDKVTEEDFFSNYVWVVISSGLSNKAAHSISDKLHKHFPDFNVITHPGKRKAISQMWKEFPKHFEKLKALKTDEERIEYIGSLFYMGPTIRYHMAKNLGIQVAKPDRHLVRLATAFGYSDVQTLCRDISQATGDKISVVDLVLWRHSALVGTRQLAKGQARLMES